MRIYLYVLFLLIALLLEISILPIPFTVIFLIFLTISEQKPWVFLAALGSGVVLDSLFFRPIGATSLFLLATSGVLFLYSRKFEINHVLFGVISASLACFFYALIFNNQYLFLILFLSIFANILVFGSLALLHLRQGKFVS